MISILELLEHALARSIAAGATISSIGSVMAKTTTGLKRCSNKRLAGAIASAKAGGAPSG
jgi:hypothetical protein